MSNLDTAQRWEDSAPPPVRLKGLGEAAIRPCGQCLRCVAACPSGALSYRDRRWHINLSVCIYCGACQAVCPNPLI